MKTIGTLAAGLALVALTACERAPGAGPGAAGSSSAQVASRAPQPVAPTPQTTYRVARVAPVIREGADLGWFRPGEGSPREVGAFVGSAVIDGVKEIFTGDRPVSLEVDVRQFRPAMDLGFETSDDVHRVKLDFVFADQATGEELARVENLFMDLIALTGSSAMIARNAGRTPEVRLSERIAQITAAWARDASCADFSCPRSTAVAAVSPAPSPKPSTPVPAAPAPLVEAPAPEAPAPVAETPAAPAPEAVAAAPAPTPAPSPAPAADADEAAEEEPDSLFAALGAILKAGAPKEEAPAAAAAAPAPTPTPEPAPVAPPAPAPIPETETAEAAPAPEAPAPVSETSAAEGEEDTGIDALFTRLFGDDETEAEEATAAAETPAPTPTPAPAPTVTPAPEPIPAPETEVAVAAPVAPEPAPSQTVVPPTAAETPPPEAGSPFFRSPAGEAPTLPQQALLGRSQRRNDPLRQRPGDVVLEVSNLPAFWDGDETTGGVWVALPYVPAFRRAIVTNPANGRTVEANLFWRDPQAGGGSTLLSSAAAQALGVSPGQVTSLGVKVVAAD